ncbi:MAG: nucleotide sugar dehydrogenase [Bacilli bacterium]|nr:nucleotide sugar dehydrogenase [Bacilli bacterium]
MSIKEKRKNKGYSQKDIAIKLGIPLRTYKRIELSEEKNHTYKHELLENKIDLLPKNLVRQNIKRETIGIIGAGNVGYPLGVLLSERNRVLFIDSDEEKIKKINNGVSLIDNYQLNSNSLKIKASSDIKTLIYCDSIIIALPTEYVERIKRFNTSKIEEYIDYISKNNPSATVVIKSTVPFGFTKKLAKHFHNLEIIFSPEFLREDHGIEDTQNPDRIIFGVKRINLKNKRMAIVLENVTNNASKTTFMSYEEAEAVKLFSNSFLAMRIAYMNEIDTFALKNNLDANKIIKGMCQDKRIGDFYNNPSFGFGGHCFPKDTKQLHSSYKESKLINAVVESNIDRAKAIAKQIMKKCSKDSTIGFYKVKNKNSASMDVASLLFNKGYNVIFFEDGDDESFNNFIKKSDLLIANRIDERISSYKEKVFTRDLFLN